VIESFNEQDVSYVIVGGLACVLHGHARLTVDVDFIVRLDTDNALKAVNALIGLGYRSRAPVEPKEFADPKRREAWIREKGMTVLSFYNPGDPVVAVDLFVDYPVAYDLLLKRSEMKDLGGVQARVCSLDDLIAMKRRVGRPRDLEDVRILETIRSEQKKHS